MGQYICVFGHDRCGQTLPGPECPYCKRMATELEISLWGTVGAAALAETNAERDLRKRPFSLRNIREVVRTRKQRVRAVDDYLEEVNKDD